MILNKASFQRGFTHASVYKSEVIFYCIFNFLLFVVD